MAVPSPRLGRYRGPGFCHVPADEPIHLERLAEADGDEDRWNEPAQPTIYLGLDLAVAVAEFARHAVPGARRFVRFDLDLAPVADLRGVALRGSGPSRLADVATIADRPRALRLAAVFRADPTCRGLLVPSLAFPDDPDRGSLVVFADRLRDGIGAWLGEPSDVGRIELGSAADGPTALSHDNHPRPPETG